MANPKVKACVTCESDEHMEAFCYDPHVWHVECLKCNYLGPASGRLRDAIRLHNAKMVEARAAQSGQMAHG